MSAAGGQIVEGQAVVIERDEGTEYTIIHDRFPKRADERSWLLAWRLETGIYVADFDPQGAARQRERMRHDLRGGQFGPSRLLQNRGVGGTRWFDCAGPATERPAGTAV